MAESKQPTTLGSALMAHFLLTVSITTLFVGIGVGFGLSKAPSYRAESRLIVGSIGAANSSVPGTVEANRQLASTYARLINTPAVKSAAKQTGPLPVGSVFASPIAQSPIIIVTATSASSENAVMLADRYSTGLRNYVAQLNGQSGESQVLEQYRAAAVDLANAKNALAAAKAGTPAATEAQATVDAAQLRVDALGQQYQTQLTSNGSGGELSSISPAASTTSDRSSNIQRHAALGLIAGLVLSAGIASTLEVRRAGRRVPRHLETSAA